MTAPDGGDVDLLAGHEGWVHGLVGAPGGGGWGGENGEEEGLARPRRRRERREGRARPRMNFSSTFLLLFLGASIFFGGIGVEEIREPYYDGNPVWDRKRSFL